MSKEHRRRDEFLLISGVLAISFLTLTGQPEETQASVVRTPIPQPTVQAKPLEQPIYKPVEYAQTPQDDLTKIFLAFGGLGAFSAAVRKMILKRDGNKSILSGETEHLQAAHLDHDKSHPHYNNPSNGVTLTRSEHYMMHSINEGRNGLSKQHNRGAMHLLWASMTEEEKKKTGKRH